MRLVAGLTPALTEEVISKLKTKRIYNVIDLMLSDPEKLASETNISYRTLLGIRRVIRAERGALATSGVEMLDEFTRSTVIISTGIPSLDILLGGGLMTGEVVEICGESGVGKTSLCASIAFHTCLKYGFDVLYIDALASVSSSRLAPFLQNSGKELEEIKQALLHFKVVSPSDVWGVFEALRLVSELPSPEKEAPGPSSEGKNKIKMVILDSVSFYFTPLMGGSRDKWGLLNSLACRLKQMSAEHQVAVVVLNNLVAADFDFDVNDQNFGFSTWKPALGRYWAHVPNTRLLIRKPAEPNSLKRKLPSDEEGASCSNSTLVCSFDIDVTVCKSTRLKIASSRVSVLKS